MSCFKEVSNLEILVLRLIAEFDDDDSLESDGIPWVLCHQGDKYQLG